jgi:hypothetical protein
MSLNRWNAKRDGNEPAIVDGLRRLGFKVIRLDAFDLLVWNPRRQTLHMLDAKTRKGRRTEAQKLLIADGWPIVFVETLDEAIGAVR